MLFGKAKKAWSCSSSTVAGPSSRVNAGPTLRVKDRVNYKQFLRRWEEIRQ